MATWATETEVERDSFGNENERLTFRLENFRVEWQPAMGLQAVAFWEDRHLGNMDLKSAIDYCNALYCELEAYPAEEARQAQMMADYEDPFEGQELGIRPSRNPAELEGMEKMGANAGVGVDVTDLKDVDPTQNPEYQAGAQVQEVPVDPEVTETTEGKGKGKGKDSPDSA